MLQKIFLVLFLSFLLDSCAHGPRVPVCVSDPSAEQSECSNYNGTTSVVSYPDSAGYAFYPPDSYQSYLNYCAARNKPGTAVPQFDSCTSYPTLGGVSCVSQKCSLNTQMNGIVCTPTEPYFLPYAATLNYISLADSDNITVLAYCNISIIAPEVLK